MEYKNYKFILIAIIVFLIIFVCISLSQANQNITYINLEPVIIYADLDGDNGKEKIIINQAWEKGNSSEVKGNVSIIVYNKETIVFKHNEIMAPLLYVYIVQFPLATKNSFRDILFIITDTGILKLNILCWESQITENDVYEKAMSEKKKRFKGQFRFIKTDVRLDTPYG